MRALVFDVAGDQCLGVLHDAVTNKAKLGVLIVVGGPQYRLGSHRQFLLLARHLARETFPCLRFDYRGLGDSEGAPRDFRFVDDDIRVAIDVFIESTDVERVVLLGLCDGASASMIYADQDPRVAGLILLNPWVHSEATESKVRLRSYYLERLRNREFWAKLLRFDLDIRDSLQSLFAYIHGAFGPSDAGDSETHFIERMRRAWAAASAPSLLILSGDDLTAGEFKQLCRDDPDWQQLVEDKVSQRLELESANHTFARAEWRHAVAEASVSWLRALD